MAKHEPCEGAGAVASRDDGTRYGNTICPTCHAIAPIEERASDGETIVSAHTVLVVDC